jgi:large subunit ribosomal protein L4e
VNQKRYAVCSAIAASGVPALVMSKGHLIQETQEFPLVVSDKVQEYDKTKQAVVFLRKLKIWKDVAKVIFFSPMTTVHTFLMMIQKYAILNIQ